MLSLVPGTVRCSHRQSGPFTQKRLAEGPRLPETLGPAGPSDSSLENQIPSPAKNKQSQNRQRLPDKWHPALLSSLRAHSHLFLLPPLSFPSSPGPSLPLSLSCLPHLPCLPLFFPSPPQSPFPLHIPPPPGQRRGSAQSWVPMPSPPSPRLPAQGKG